MEIQLIDDLVKSGLKFDAICDFPSYIIKTASWALLGCMLDFCISVLGVGYDNKEWQVMKDLIQHCSFIFQFENVCICCNRPCKLSFDSENRLHGEGEPAIQFRDGFSVYACHGKHPSDEY